MTRTVRKDTGIFLALGAVLFLVPLTAAASEPVAFFKNSNKPVIALVIDDLGNSMQTGKQIVELPGPVACAFLPHAAYTKRLARLANLEGKEVMLHLPMQAMRVRELDRGGLTLEMSESTVRATLFEGLAAVPHVIGVNNHMGSLLTRHPGHMHWVMKAIQNTGSLFFVDSRTTDHSVARKMALEEGVPATQRDIFLDVHRDKETITRQFKKLLAKARRNGVALGIGHPYPETIAVLQKELEKLDREHVRLVSVTELIRLKKQRRNTWHASLSH